MNDFFARRDERAKQLQTDIEAGTLEFDNGWLVEIVNKHTCGTSQSGYYGMHEPGCGREPIFDVAAAMIHDEDAMNAAMDEYDHSPIEENFWDDRTTPLAYSAQDSGLDMAAIRRLREHFAAHLDVARVDGNTEQERGAAQLMEDLRTLIQFRNPR